ncbi:MAG: GDSL family lipase [Flammeovirgaceae bacterium]|nr:GDSL family lipase [Flammeovirgaceae bacterium]MBE62045.1 GDSL family lipase [Flammeovirgaceae bacterium]MBR11124.1 GDSL family lipase [Rickettsiales bacterium]HCX21751.1 GDSL family lipase [Cytophagales bacterium]|tara:strand:- start:1 stop:603 length:603 start_codon:yes stop_codon:yes gene_type:complete
MEVINMEFESEIEDLEKKIIDFPNKEDLTVFFGSSSIRLWETLEEDMAPLNVLNLGFGGSSFSWCIYYFDRLFTKIKPKHIVIYVGDNDLANGIPPEKVVKKFRTLAHLIRTSFPYTPMDFITIKPSPSRTYLLPEIKLTNSLIRKELMNVEKASLINIFDSMLSEKGVARPELYLEDELHMNAKGYKIWKGVVRKHFGI